MIALRIAEIRARIEAAARRARRDPGGVVLVAVSKTRAADEVRAAYDAGLREFGENYAQEMISKADALAALRGIRWHFIGHLQRNKARDVTGRAALVHGVDSARLAEEIDRRAAQAGVAQDVLIEVNTGGEASKSGVAPADLGNVLAASQAAPHLRVRGLMTIPPAEGDPRPFFRALRDLRDAHGGATALPELSMGMSADYETAIEEGATIVRVGTAIFGTRE